MELMLLPPERPKRPIVSQSLGAAMRNIEQGQGVAVSAHLSREAVTALRDYERVCLPATYQEIHNWMQAIQLSFEPPLSDDDFENRAESIIPALIGLPRFVFNADTQRELCRERREFSRAFPGSNRFYEVLSSRCADWLSEMAALRKLAAATAAPPAAEPERTGRNMAADERDAVLAKFRADMAADRAAHAPAEPVEPVKVKAYHFNDEQLLASYEALVVKGGTEGFRRLAMTRRDMLRRKLGLAPAPEATP